MSGALLPVVNDAIDVLQTPGNTVVRRFADYITDRNDMAVPPGDPKACRFCAAGLVRHSAARVRRPGEVVHNLYGGPVSSQEEETIAGGYGTLIAMFSHAWYSGHTTKDNGDESFDPEKVRLTLVSCLLTAKHKLELQAAKA